MSISVCITLVPLSLLSSSSSLTSPNSSISYPFLSPKSRQYPFLSSSYSPSITLTLVFSNPSEQEAEPSSSSTEEDEWHKKLPHKNNLVYSHSLPCVEAWLKNLGFYQSKDDRAVWLVQMPEWHAQLSLDITDLYIRYLKSGPGNIEKDVERRFSYALSRGCRECHTRRTMKTKAKCSFCLAYHDEFS